MPRRGDGDGGSTESSLTAPPNAPFTEMYQPAPRRRSTGSARATATLDDYHARVTSFGSGTDGRDEDEDTLTMPVPQSVRRATQETAVAPPQQQQPQQPREVPRQGAAVKMPSEPLIKSAPAAAAPPPPPPQSPPPPPLHDAVSGEGATVPWWPPSSVPAPTLVALFQQQQQQQHPQQQQQQQQQQQPHQLLLPDPYDRPSSPVASAPAVCGTPQQQQQNGSTSPWQLRSPQHHHHHVSPTPARVGAVFDYASEAVNTLEQQYSDTMQRLTTMHRLYDRLDAQNRTLESEVVRLRKANDVLQKGVAFGVYNSVRQVRHEMKLLRQYVAVLCTGFSNSLQALQQVVAEDVPRLQGRDSAYTALLPYGAQGRLQAAETRVSISRGAHLSDRLPSSAALPQMLPHRVNADEGGGVGAVAEAQLYQPGYWWNAMSPQPLCPPPPQQEQQQQWMAGQHTGAVVVHNSGGFRHDVAGVVAPCGSVEGAVYSPPPPQQQQHSSTTQEMVSYTEYRRVQAALAEAQRRVVELEQRTTSQQSDFEDRVAQLKAAHRARLTRVEEEVALLKKVEPIAREGDATPVGPVTVDINTLTQLIAGIQQQQHVTQSASLVSAGVTANTNRPKAEHTIAFSGHSDDAADEDDGLVDSRNPHSSGTATRSRSSSSSTNRKEEDGEEVGSKDDKDFARFYGRADPRRCFDRTNRRVVQATALGTGRPHTVSGDDGRLHRPDRYSAPAAAQRVEVARRVLGEKERETSRSGAPRFLAYDRLRDQQGAATRGAATSPAGRARRTVSPSARHSGGGGSGNGGAGGYASKQARGRGAPAASMPGSSADRLAQGIWAQEVLKDRHYL